MKKPIYEMVIKTHIFINLFNPWNGSRKLSGKAAATECNSNVSYLKDEIYKVQLAFLHARDNIEEGTLPPRDAVKDLPGKFNALLEKLGCHQQKFIVEVITLKNDVDLVVTFAEHFDICDGSWREFKDWYDAGGMYAAEYAPGGICVNSFGSELEEMHTIAIARAMFHMQGPGDDACSTIAENLTDDTNQEEIAKGALCVADRAQGMKQGDANAIKWARRKEILNLHLKDSECDQEK